MSWYLIYNIHTSFLIHQHDHVPDLKLNPIGQFFCQENFLLLMTFFYILSRKKRVYLIVFTLSQPYPHSHHIVFPKVCPVPRQQKKGS